MKDSSGKIIDALTNSEYNEHKHQEHLQYEFSEFIDADLFARTSKPITKMLNFVKNTLKRIKGTGSRIIFITARPDFDDKEKFLSVFRKHGVDIDKIYVFRAGPCDNPAWEKADITRGVLITMQYEKAIMYDDNLENLQAFKDLSHWFPGIEFETFQVLRDGSLHKY